MSADPLEPSHEDPQPRRVEELDLLEVDHEVVLPLVDELDDPPPEFRRRVDVDLPADLDDGAVVLLTCLERQVHGFSSGSVRCARTPSRRASVLPHVQPGHSTMSRQTGFVPLSAREQTPTAADNRLLGLLGTHATREERLT